MSVPLTCPHHPLTPSPIPSAWLICLIKVCGQEPIHLISLAKPGTIYLPVLEKTSTGSCWECWEKNRRVLVAEGFPLKQRGVWVVQARSWWHQSRAQEPSTAALRESGERCRLPQRQQEEKGRHNWSTARLLITLLGGSYKTCCMWKLTQWIWLLQELIFIQTSEGKATGGLAATLIFAVSATVRILLPSVSLPAGQPPEIRSLSLASKGCYSVACLNEGNPFVPWKSGHEVREVVGARPENAGRSRRALTLCGCSLD